MNIITLVLFVVCLATMFLPYMCNLALGWELFAYVLLAIPIYAYKRKSLKLWNTLFMCTSANFVFRYHVVGFLISKGVAVEVPISLDQLIIKQYAGLGNLAWMIVYYLIIMLLCLVSEYSYIKECKTYEELMHNKNIIRTTNIFTLTSVVLFINITLTIFLYSLHEFVYNMLGIIAAVFVIAICRTFYQISMIRDKKLVFLEEYNKSANIDREKYLHDLVKSQDDLVDLNKE